MISTISTIIASVVLSLGSFFGISSWTEQPVFPSSEYQEEVRNYIDEYVKSSSKVMEDSIKLGAAPDYFAGSTFNIAGSGVSSSATSITLASFTIVQTGQKIITADLIAGVGNKFYLTLEPGNRTKQEIVSCTAVTQNSNGTATLTGCSRGLSPITPYTASTTLSYVHAGGSQVILSNPPQLYRDLIDYIDDASIAGAVDSSLTAKGIVEKATGAEAATHAAVGSGNTTAPLALTTDIASSTRTGANQVVIVASTTGYIDNTFIATSTSQGGGLGLFTNVTLSGTTTIASTTATGLSNIATASSSSYTTSFTWTKKYNVKYVHVRVQAGGGGGDDDGGGDGGGYCEKVVLAANLGATESVTVGAAGSGNAGTSATAGGNSAFGSHCTATGGGVNQGGTGTATGGNINITGQSGTDISSLGITGFGGSSFMGFGGFPGGVFGGDGSGIVGYGYGAGGGGSDGTGSGANGTQGIVYITEYLY